METVRNRYILSMSRRNGFFKLALETGASVIPCMSFGETSIYNTIKARKGTYTQKIQDWIQRRLGFPAFLFYANGLAPYPKPINTVVGAPISCDRVMNPTVEQISALKSEYVENLLKLFRRYKNVYDPLAEEVEII
ncbi:unnamed protein product [Calicophoron daubneyi]|uniref:Uncharacterized protein n=1 Tax=Calicophoron daubneyi TaxID=300641 RepID=A0AAV2T2L3_CALDB